MNRWYFCFIIGRAQQTHTHTRSYTPYNFVTISGCATMRKNEPWERELWHEFFSIDEGRERERIRGQRTESLLIITRLHSHIDVYKYKTHFYVSYTQYVQHAQSHLRYCVYVESTHLLILTLAMVLSIFSLVHKIFI